jgi:hypothetical protein
MKMREPMKDRLARESDQRWKSFWTFVIVVACFLATWGLYELAYRMFGEEALWYLL